MWGYWRDVLGGMMSERQYLEHRTVQKNKDVITMCKPISTIRNMDASQLLSFCEQTDKIPVNLREMLKKLKIACLPVDFSSILHGQKDCDGILGALITNGNNAAIFYKQDDQPDSHRYRFTIAHELAHCCLAHYDVKEESIHLALRQDVKTQDPQEIAANIFAGELLIPKDSLTKIISELLLPSVKTLADIFAVSSNVMLARLEYLRICDKIIGYNC